DSERRLQKNRRIPVLVRVRSHAEIDAAQTGVPGNHLEAKKVKKERIEILQDERPAGQVDVLAGKLHQAVGPQFDGAGIDDIGRIDRDLASGIDEQKELAEIQ